MLAHGSLATFSISHARAYAHPPTCLPDPAHPALAPRRNSFPMLYKLCIAIGVGLAAAAPTPVDESSASLTPVAVSPDRLPMAACVAKCEAAIDATDCHSHFGTYHHDIIQGTKDVCAAECHRRIHIGMCAGEDAHVGHEVAAKIRVEHDHHPGCKATCNECVKFDESKFCGFGTEVKEKAMNRCEDKCLPIQEDELWPSPSSPTPSGPAPAGPTVQAASGGPQTCEAVFNSADPSWSHLYECPNAPCLCTCRSAEMEALDQVTQAPAKTYKSCAAMKEDGLCAHAPCVCRCP